MPAVVGKRADGRVVFATLEVPVFQAESDPALGPEELFVGHAGRNLATVAGPGVVRGMPVDVKPRSIAVAAVRTGVTRLAEPGEVGTARRTCREPSRVLGCDGTEDFAELDFAAGEVFQHVHDRLLGDGVERAVQG